MSEERQQSTTKKTASKRKVASQSASASPGNSAPRRAPRKAPPEKPAATRSTATKAAVGRQVSPEERYRMIQEAAYYHAEKEGFKCDPWKCWLAAEAEIDEQLSGGA